MEQRTKPLEATKEPRFWPGEIVKTTSVRPKTKYLEVERLDEYMTKYLGRNTYRVREIIPGANSGKMFVSSFHLSELQLRHTFKNYPGDE